MVDVLADMVWLYGSKCVMVWREEEGGKRQDGVADYSQGNRLLRNTERHLKLCWSVHACSACSFLRYECKSVVV